MCPHGLDFTDILEFIIQKFRRPIVKNVVPQWIPVLCTQWRFLQSQNDEKEPMCKFDRCHRDD